LDLREGATVVDLAAGTGKLARQLVTSGARVVAVEPVAAMRDLIPRGGIDVLTGAAEAIPLPLASADAVVVAQAFHWFNVDAAFATDHAVHLGEGGIEVEPLEGLCNDDRVGGLGRQRDRFSGTRQHVDAVAVNQLAHRRDRLDCDDAGSRRDQLPCELACSRRKVDDGGALTKIQAVDEV